MNDQIRCKPLAPLGFDFDKFLFAAVGEEQNGMALSVNSALARLNIDPWDEAAALARMPRAEATRRLTTLITALPNGSAALEPEQVATRLIALLPQRVGTPSVGRIPFGNVRSMVESPSGIYVILILILIVSVVAVQWLGAESRAQAEVGQTVGAHQN